MKFELGNVRLKEEFYLIYRKNEYSFDVEPSQEIGFASVLINDLHLEIDDKGNVLYVWGLCPFSSYQETKETPKEYKSCYLVISIDETWVPGISYRFNFNRWPVYLNQSSGWVCIGDPHLDKNLLIEFAPNCVAMLNRKQLQAIWLQPKIIT